MRIVLDLHACQTAAAFALGDHPTLRLTQEIARLGHASGHDVRVVFCAGDGAQAETLRHAFAGLLPPSQLLAVTLPPAGVGPSVLELVRQGALAALAPELLFIPEFDRAPRQWALPAADCDTVLTLRDAPAFLAEANATLRQCAADAALLLCHGALPEPAGDARLRRLDDDVVAAANQAWQAFEALARARVARRHSEGKRLRLAYVSPLPPAQSGIADYSAQLLPALTPYYDIDAIVDQPLVEPQPGDGVSVRSVAWFEAHAHEYDRVMYHFGNSPFHKHMFALLERHPGVVVLHDFYLGNVLEYLKSDGYTTATFVRALFEAHGYAALADLKQNGRTAAAWKYPCNKAVLEQACGVIAHSALSRELAAQWYGPALSVDWRVIPLLRDAGAALPERAAARARFALGADDFVLASFGMLGPAKLNHRLLEAWLASPLAADPRCRLVFVGAPDGMPYSDDLMTAIEASGCAARISVTGYVSADDYRAWLAAADCAVQLRTSTRGETSAAILDCLMAGLPTIVNAHGSAIDLPRDVLVMLDDEFTQPALSEALRQLFAEPHRRAELAARAARFVREQHSAEPVGRAYFEAIEQFAGARPPHAYRELVGAIGAAAPRAEPQHTLALAHAAAAIAANRPAGLQGRLFVDVSAVVQADIKTGIQRVVRSVVQALLTDPPAGLRVEPVYTRGGNRMYRHARRWTAELLGAADPEMPEGVLDDEPIDARPGDVFLGLDLLISDTHLNEELLLDMRVRGVQVYFVVFDVLPVLRPEVFPEETPAAFANWISTISTVADGLICISRAVADEMHEWLLRAPPSRSAPLHIGYFHLGADIAASLPTFGMPDEAERVLEAVRARPTLLSVGTVEPRKGHAQSLDAFERLWARGVDVNFVIVGKHGWMVDALAARLKAHPEAGRRLLWLEGVSDEMLLALYETSSALLAASEGEGFGLPLIEAAQHQLPIIARGLPVFREVLGEHGFYFNGLDGHALAAAIDAWLTLDRQGRAPQSTGLRWLTWAESARQLCAVMQGKEWYRTIAGTR